MSDENERLQQGDGTSGWRSCLIAVCASTEARGGLVDAGRSTNIQRHGMGVFGEFECERRHRRRRSVLDSQGESIVGLFAQIEIGVAPGVELGRAAERLAGTDAASALLGVMNDQDGDGVAAL